MGRNIHFEIHAENPERAAQFYKALLDWEFTKWQGPIEYWIIKTGPDATPGINGGLLRRQGPGPVEGQAVNAFVCTAQVDSLDAALGQLTSLGGVLAVPKMPVPGYGWLAYAKDTEGNIFGLIQHDPSAK